LISSLHSVPFSSYGFDLVRSRWFGFMRFCLSPVEVPGVITLPFPLFPPHRLALVAAPLLSPPHVGSFLLTNATESAFLSFFPLYQGREVFVSPRGFLASLPFSCPRPNALVTKKADFSVLQPPCETALRKTVFLHAHAAPESDPVRSRNSWKRHPTSLFTMTFFPPMPPGKGLTSLLSISIFFFYFREFTFPPFFRRVRNQV